MIEILDGLPAGVVGVRVGGRLTNEDYEERIRPMVEQARRDGRRLRCLIEIEDDFAGLTPPAIVDDVRIGVRTVGAYDGVAVATDLSWIRHATEWAAFFVPFPMRVFPRAGRAPAVEWLAGLPAEATAHPTLDESTGVVTVEVTEALRIEDFEALAAVVDPWTESHGELAGLVVHVRSVPGWTNLGSLVRHVRFVAGHHGKVGRVALATDVRGASGLAAMAGHLIHPEVHVFSYADLPAAQVWAAGTARA